jgi:hypothetical protein
MLLVEVTLVVQRLGTVLLIRHTGVHVKGKIHPVTGHEGPEME